MWSTNRIPTPQCTQYSSNDHSQSPFKGKDFSLFDSVKTSCGGKNSLYAMGIEGNFLGQKLPKRETWVLVAAKRTQDNI